MYGLLEIKTKTMKTFKRSFDSMIGGVCGGVANYFKIDPTIVRVIWVIAALVYGVGVLLYIIIWMVAPEE